MTYSLVTPPIIETPFASSAGGGYVNTVPVTASSTPGLASYETGFPPVTMQDPNTTGIQPAGQDFNGVLKDVTSHLQFINAGQRYKFNSTLATAIGGYPVGAILQSNDGTKEFINISANNTTDFNTTTSSIGVSWILYNGGANVYLDLTGTVGTNVTLDPLTQANYKIIDVNYTLTANVAVIVPTAPGQWTFNNSTGGNYTLTVRTASGSGVLIPQGSSKILFCDGVNVYESVISLPTGSIISFLGSSAPSGFIACLNSAWTLNRNTYARLFSVFGTTFGTGDGSTTFGMPYFPDGYSLVAGSPGTANTVGQNLAHTHPPAVGSSFVVSPGSWNGSGGTNGNYNGGTATGSSGGAANLAAGVYSLMCVKY